MSKIYTIEEIKEIVTPIAKAYGVEKMAVFGSVARGEATAESDIDFLIEQGEKIRGLIFSEFCLKIEAVLDKKVDVITYNSLERSFINKYARADEVIFYEL